MGFGFGPIPSFVQTTTAAPTGTASTSLVMLGLATTITPLVTGRLLIMACGNMANSATNDGGTWLLAYGTGGAPSNGGAAAGTTTGTTQQMSQDLLSTDKFPFFLQSFVTTLVVGTTYWLDLQFAAATGGTFSMSSVTLTALEL